MYHLEEQEPGIYSAAGRLALLLFLAVCPRDCSQNGVGPGNVLAVLF